MAARLVCLRHAQTLAAGRCVGRTDVSTKLLPKEASDKMREELSTWCRSAKAGLPPCSVWSSPLSRCQAPAAHLAAYHGVKMSTDPRLLELDFGEWEGRTWAELEREDGERLLAWMNDWRVKAPPAGETTEALTKRVSSWWQEQSTRSGLHVLVAHSGVVKALLVMGGWTWDDAMSYPIPHLRAMAPFEQ